MDYVSLLVGDAQRIPFIKGLVSVYSLGIFLLKYMTGNPNDITPVNKTGLFPCRFQMKNFKINITQKGNPSFPLTLLPQNQRN